MNVGRDPIPNITVNLHIVVGENVATINYVQLVVK